MTDCLTGAGKVVKQGVDNSINMACNLAMTEKRHADADIIDRLGGPATVARLLNYDPAEGGVQRVFNWTKRGIPPRVLLDHAEVFAAASAALQKAS